MASMGMIDTPTSLFYIIVSRHHTGMMQAVASVVAIFQKQKKKKGEKNGPENSIMCVTSRLFSRAATFMTSCADRHLTKKLER